MTIQLPEKVKFIIDTLTDAGFEAYAVGVPAQYAGENGVERAHP